MSRDTLAVYSRIYNQLYRFGYHRSRDYSHAHAVIARIADGRLPVRSALDVGCAAGGAVAAIGALGVRAAGVDVATRAVRRGVTAGRDLRVASATSLPFPDGSFDLVMSTDCFEHLHRSHVEAAVSETYRVSARFLAFKINPRPDQATHWRVLAATRLH